MTETLVQKEQVSEQMIKAYLFGSGTKLTDTQLKMFLGIAQSFNLNPFKREIHAIPYEKNKLVNGKWEKVSDMNVITGYQVYIERAMNSGMLDGRNVQIVKKDDGKIDGANIVIYRKDWKQPFEWFCAIKEFVKLNKEGIPQSSRATMPEFMIKKVAIGQGFRLAFPNELGGMPCLSEEITEDKEKAIDEKDLLKDFEKPVEVLQ